MPASSILCDRQLLVLRDEGRGRLAGHPSGQVAITLPSGEALERMPAIPGNGQCASTRPRGFRGDFDGHPQMDPAWEISVSGDDAGTKAAYSVTVSVAVVPTVRRSCGS